MGNIYSHGPGTFWPSHKVQVEEYIPEPVSWIMMTSGEVSILNESRSVYIIRL